MGVSKNCGTPKCIVYNGKPFKMDNLGVPPFRETSIYTYIYKLQTKVFVLEQIQDPKKNHHKNLLADPYESLTAEISFAKLSRFPGKPQAQPNR